MTNIAFTKSMRALALTIAFVALPTVGTSCEGNDRDSHITPTPDAAVDTAPPPISPLYAIASSVFGDTGSTTYVNLLDSLDVRLIDYARTREFRGGATISAIGGKLFVADGEAPVITRYLVKDDRTLQEDGRISFGNYGLKTAPFYASTFVSPTKVYQHHEKVRRIVWNPAALEIGKLADAPGIALERDGRNVAPSFDRGSVIRDNRVFHSFSWFDKDYRTAAATSQIAVYDATTDQLVALTDIPCPATEIATKDEAGNLYFSNWVFSLTAPLTSKDAPKNCIVRVSAGKESIDQDWTVRIADLTGGREGAALRYLKNGKAVLAVFHHEDVKFDGVDDHKLVWGGDTWRLWLVDLKSKTAKPIEGIHRITGGYYLFEFEGRFFALLPSKDYAKTTAYEIFENGTAVPHFETRGWAYQFVKVR